MNPREQYERFPYPPVPTLALPARGEGSALSLETGCRLTGVARSLEGYRVLVAGAGTLEPCVAAQANPRASELVAVDLSAVSLALLTRRDRWMRVARFPSRLPPIRKVRADLREWEPSGKFDLILASNLLHHVEDPASLLARLSSWLAPDGLLRVVTYPRASRVWMRETGRYLRSHGISPENAGRARALISMLGPGDPVRLCFESQPETRTPTGVVDAFLHACENPLSPLEWRDACARAGLRLAAEAQDEASRSSFLVEVLPETAVLDAWERLEVLDAFLEICANPVLWLVPAAVAAPAAESVRVRIAERAAPLDGPGALTDELRANLRRAESLLARAGLTAARALTVFREKVGPRFTADGKRALKGLALSDYDPATLCLLG